MHMKTQMKKLYEKYMFFMGFAGQLVFYLQAYKIFSIKDAEGVSLVAFCFGLLSVSSWLIYGIIIRNRVLVYANAFAMVGAVAVITGILIYS